MNRKELIKKYKDFFKSKNHKEISNVNLIPENDPTALFISAGMHSLVPYLLGQKHPLGKRLYNIQRCIRTNDIEEVGDTYHHTFFEMLGNWSLGDYWKKEAIEYTFEFLIKILKIPKEKLAVSCFKGDKKIPKDVESAKIWRKLGITQERIIFLDRKGNWWGPIGKKGPCGPDTEVFYWKSKSEPVPKKFDLKNENWIEIGNDVLMEYNKNENGNYNSSEQKNVDFGGGIERIVALLNGFEDNYLTDMWKPLIDKVEKLSKKKYYGNEGNTKSMRIIVDHLKASVFIIADGIVPSNTEQGYILRRLLRRAIRYKRILGMKNSLTEIVEPLFRIYEDYKFLEKNKKKILEEVAKEEERFNKTIEKGINILNKIIKNKKEISGKDSFLLYQSYGFPIEITEEIAKEKGIKVNKEEFQRELTKHQKLSRTATAGRFKSGLADNSENTTKLHTATHLLLAALRIVLKDKNIIQKGSNITPERLRLDFSFPRKLTKEELEEVENLVNSQIKKSLEVIREEMSLEEARESGALGIFENKYGNKVSVYTIGNFSKEICSGPHVKNTKELGHFRIKKEESSSLGVRRIKAILD